MSEEIEIREAELQDIPFLIEMRKKLEKHVEKNNKLFLCHSNSFIQNLNAYYQSKIRKPSSKLFLAYVKGEPENVVGMSLGKIVSNDEHDPPRTGRIDDVWVEPEYRRMGTCEIMVKELVEFFKRNKVYDLVLEYAIYDHEAEETWRKMGFQPSVIISTAKIDEVNV